MPHKKPNLPEKTCVICGRPFTWRKKWERVWNDVKYCSDKCRKNREGKATIKSGNLSLSVAIFDSLLLQAITAIGLRSRIKPCPSEP